MSVISPDPGQLHVEQEALKRKQREDGERAKYLADLKANRKFRKYVMQEIFENTLNDVFSLDKLPVSDEMDKLGSVALQYVLARKAIQKIIDKLR